MRAALLLVLMVCGLQAGQPQLKPIKAVWSPYIIPAGSSNAVITIYKSTSLGTVWTPFKPTAIVPANRTNINFSVLPGLYRFFATARAQPFQESGPSNISTNRVNP